MRTHITDVSVRALRPAARQYKCWDTRTKGFGVLVSGQTKSWFVSFGKERRLKTLGRYPDLSLADARKKALSFLGAEQVPGQPKSMTFEAAVPLFLEDNYKHVRGKRTKSEAKRLLEKHFLPSFAKRPLSEITDRDISHELAKLANTPSTQLHAYRAIKVMMRWCTRPPRRYIPVSPLHDYEPPGKDTKRNRILSDDELIKVWRASTGKHGAMVRLLILWGSRSGETARLQRTWLEDGIVTIPGTFTNGRSHAIPLLPMAKAILDAQKSNSAYFFPGRLLTDEHFNDGSWGKLKGEIATEAGVSDWQIRDLRRTFRSNMAKLKVPREIAEILLNHVTGANRNDLDEIYNRYDYLDEKREALTKWEERLTTLLAR